MKALVTGIAGFTGRYLATELHSAGYEIHGVVQSAQRGTIAGVSVLHVCDLGHAVGLLPIVEEAQPDLVVHLAGISFVAHGDAEEIYRSNLIGTRNLLESLSRSRKPLRAVLLASSANVYGNAGGVLDESTPPAPANDYAVSKLAMEFVARLYRERLPIIITRPFNYTGVGQAPSFLLPKIVDHVRQRLPAIELGNLDVARDFSDVRTVVKYYRGLLEAPGAVGNTFNVCSGRAYTLQSVLDLVRSLSGHEFEVQVNPAFVRANEVKHLVGNRGRLLALVGNVSDIPLEDTLRWMIEAPGQ